MDKLALMHDENLKLVFFVLVSDNVCFTVLAQIDSEMSLTMFGCLRKLSYA